MCDKSQDHKKDHHKDDYKTDTFVTETINDLLVLNKVNYGSERMLQRGQNTIN